MTFIIVGGGPTGVEMAGAIAELARKALATDFRRIDPRRTRVCLVEAGDRILSAFDVRLSAYAQRTLEKLGVEVLLSAPVTRCYEGGVQLPDRTVPAATILWAAGVAASPVASWLGAEADPNGRVIVGSDLAVTTAENVFAIGDTALCCDQQGRPLPGIAPVAKQQGSYVAHAVARRVRGRTQPEPFRYRDAGLLATIGRHGAIAQFGRFRLRGRLAWWFWGIVHIYFLINLRSRLTVAIQWLWSYLTFDRGARLIIREPENPPRPRA